MKEQSQIDDMRAAIRAERERAEQRRRTESPPARPDESEPALERDGDGAAPAGGLLARLFRRR